MHFKLDKDEQKKGSSVFIISIFGSFFSVVLAPKATKKITNSRNDNFIIVCFLSKCSRLI